LDKSCKDLKVKLFVSEKLKKKLLCDQENYLSTLESKNKEIIVLNLSIDTMKQALEAKDKLLDKNA